MPRPTVLAFALSAGAAFSPAPAQQLDPSLYSSLEWRMIGPFRAGRTIGATGVRGQPNVFYVGVNNGGVWRTTDYGRVWTPIFESQPTGSIGDLAVAPSNPNVIYVGTGEGVQRPDLSTGDGIYKSTDAGKTWRHLGLRDGQQIGGVIVDPRDENRIFVAVLGHPYGPNPERGVYRSTNGGESFERVLYKDENTGAIQVGFDPTNPQIVYAALWAGRQGPWENASWNGPLSGLFKSLDGGTTWRQLTTGLPTTAQGLGRIGFTIAPSDPRRMYATVDAPTLGGIYRSDDAGESWRRTNDEVRVWGRASDFAEVKVDPRNADVMYSANTSTYRSTDGGRTFTPIKGAPGGDDYHRIWINPDNPDIMLIASDQGATITVNGGATWSSWYNQPTAQFYHVITDNRVPYWVYGGQQESGSVGTVSRGDYGAITFREWNPVGAEEYGYVAPDPLDPNIVYGGKISRFDQRSREVQNISPEAVRSGKYRFLRTAPIIFSTVDPHALYYGSNVLFKTMNGGHSWSIISPDLTRQNYDVPSSYGMYTDGNLDRAKNRGVIYTIAPSFRNANTIWTGSDDGSIQVTRDGGKTWTNVTPNFLTPWSKVSLMEASHFDDQSAYAAINRFKLDDLHPHIYRTHDGGASWKEIVKGIPENEVVNSVREDPLRPGLLFAGTERAVYFSLDDGEQWQPLRLNMPATSIRDLVIHDNDIVVGTHGRSFWILDDMTPLRQLDRKAASAETFLFKPKLTYRFRRNKNTDTPLPPEEPAGKNPPDGAIINYRLGSETRTPVVLAILNSAGSAVRSFSSADSVEPIESDLNVPSYWIRPPQRLATNSGTHRFVWDLHYPAPKVLGHEYPISAIYGDTPRYPLGPAVLPGEYTLRLTVNGRSYSQPLTIKMDPRAPITAAGLKLQHDTGVRMNDAISRAFAALGEIRRQRTLLKTQREGAKAGEVADSLIALDSALATIESGSRSGTAESLVRLNGELAGVLDTVEGADMEPTTQVVTAAADLERALASVLAQWSEIQRTRLRRN
ncbi:MAG: glycoside hydrolase [Gemmatimonadota bacterium]|nr:glycoside hydrolase [Gemmatimonadota bacterium]